MSFFLQTRLEGMAEVRGLVSQIDHELKQGLRGRLKEAVGLVAEEMRALTHSKRVRAAISTDVEVLSLFDFRAAAGPTRRRAFFAHFLEFGTVHSRAFPFAGPALEATEDRIVELVGIPPSLR